MKKINVVEEESCTDVVLHSLEEARLLVEKSIRVIEKLVEESNNSGEMTRLLKYLQQTRKRILLSEIMADVSLIPDPERLVGWLEDVI